MINLRDRLNRSINRRHCKPSGAYPFDAALPPRFEIAIILARGASSSKRGTRSDHEIMI